MWAIRNSIRHPLLTFNAPHFDRLHISCPQWALKSESQAAQWNRRTEFILHELMINRGRESMTNSGVIICFMFIVYVYGWLFTLNLIFAVIRYIYSFDSCSTFCTSRKRCVLNSTRMHQNDIGRNEEDDAKKKKKIRRLKRSYRMLKSFLFLCEKWKKKHKKPNRILSTESMKMYWIQLTRRHNQVNCTKSNWIIHFGNFRDWSLIGLAWAVSMQTA